MTNIFRYYQEEADNAIYNELFINIIFIIKLIMIYGKKNY
jgi:hypothetical protein